MIVVDTLRADHAYGRSRRRRRSTRSVANGLSFTRVFPEAMPTVPARNSILTGKPDVPVPRLGGPPRPDRQARLDSRRRCRLGVHDRAAAQRLLDRLRHGQPLPRVLVSIRPAAAQLRRIRAPRRSAGRRWERRTSRDAAPLAPPGERGQENSRARELLHRQRELLEGREPVIRGEGVQLRDPVLDQAARSVPSRWSSTPSSRTSRGHRRTATCDSTATPPARPSRRCPATRTWRTGSIPASATT